MSIDYRNSFIIRNNEFNIGLAIIDEEQHFGVAQKEQLKKMGVISMFWRFLQLHPSHIANGVIWWKMSPQIATPPVDRLAIRTFVGPWDSIILREAIMREKNRGGQVFCMRSN